MRTFIGIDFDIKVKNEIKATQLIVKENSIRGRFKRMDNFHLTLKFLGEISKTQISQINEVLEASSKEVGSFALKIEKLGFFGGGNTIRSLWLGVGGDITSLDALYKNIEKGLVMQGFPKEKRPYRPHITIAQDLQISTGYEELKKKLNLSNIPTIDVKEVSLIKSEEIQRRRVYTPISTFKLLG